MTHNILIADDHEGIRRRVRALLEGAGFEVCGEATDGQEAIDKSKALVPDLVILDLSMPVMSGFEALPHIAKLKPTKILIFSVEESREMKRRALELGAHAYVTKSNPTGLLAEVNGLLGMALVVTLFLH